MQDQEQTKQEQNANQPANYKKKKKENPIVLALIICFSLLLIACFPFKFMLYDDGGTWRTISAAITVVCWQETVIDYELGTVDTEPVIKVYFFPNNFKTLEELRALESGD